MLLKYLALIFIIYYTVIYYLSLYRLLFFNMIICLIMFKIEVTLYKTYTK